MAVKKLNFIIANNDFETFNKMLILGTTAAAMDIEVNFFFTFWGLYLIKKGYKPKVSGMGSLMAGMATSMFTKLMKESGIEDPIKMLKEAHDSGKLKLYPCSMTLDMLAKAPMSYKLKKEQLLDFVEAPVGAASFLEMCDGADSIIHM
ncbi:MAG: DsrE/DsrF/DrsH-like family protein [Candidatus Sigynarchaeota archaeon]